MNFKLATYYIVMKVDYILSYIDYNQKEIRDLYEEVVGEPCVAHYNQTYIDIAKVIRLIFKNMPFVDRVFLVCKDVQRLPDSVTKMMETDFHDRLIRVNESEILPDGFVTFSSACIEMFMYRIRGLREHFIYGCDDMIPLKPLKFEDFFMVNGDEIKPTTKIVYLLMEYNSIYNLHCSNNTNLIYDRHDNNDNYIVGIVSEHTMRPLTKTICRKCYEDYEKFILASLHPYRFFNNFNMDLFILYGHHNGMLVNKELSYKFLFDIIVDDTTNLNHINYLFDGVDDTSIPHVICINDNMNSDPVVREVNSLLDSVMDKALVHEKVKIR